MANEPTLEELLAALHDLEQRWDQRLREANAQTDRLRLKNAHESYYHRGMSDGLKLALQDLYAVLGHSAIEPEPDTTGSSVNYAVVDKEAALAVLKRAGLLVADLHEHPDHTFSIFFSPLQVTSFDDRIERLSAAADVEILDYGKLSNSSKTYLDFGFKTSPER